MSPDLAGLVPSGAFLFVIARAENGGAPLAVLRVPVPDFPYDFTLAEFHAMPRRDVGLAGVEKVHLVARVDRDGRAGPPAPGDLEGTCLGNPVSPGDQACEIVIDRRH